MKQTILESSHTLEIPRFWCDLKAVQLQQGQREGNANPLKTKRRPLYLNTQSIPCSKHFSSRL